MSRKILVYSKYENEERVGEPIRVYFKNGECKNPEVKGIVSDGDYRITRMNYTGRKQAEKGFIKHRPLTLSQIMEVVNKGREVKSETNTTQTNENNEINRPVKTGKRGRASKYTQEELKQVQEAANTAKMDLKAYLISVKREGELKALYPILNRLDMMPEVRAKKGRALGSGKANTIDVEMIAKMKKCAEEGLTLKETETALNVPYAALYIQSKKNKIIFKAGKKGFQKKELAAA